VAQLTAAADYRASFRQAIFCFNLGPMILNHVADTQVGTAFFAGLREEDHVTIKRDIQAFEQYHQHHARDGVILIVDRAPTIDVPVLAGGAERRIEPLFRLHAHGIRVPHDEQRLLGAISLQPCHKIDAIGLLAQKLNRNPLALEDFFHILGRLRLIAGRIGRVQANQRLKVFEQLGVNFGPFGLCRPGDSNRRGAQQKSAEDSYLTDFHHWGSPE
jgi:hypothetical protein